MKFQHIQEAVYFQPWNITGPGWLSVHSILQKHVASAEQIKIQSDSGTDFFGEPLPELQIMAGGQAVVPIKGTLIQHAGMLEKMCGACSYDDIKANIRQAVEMGCTVICLDIASPGGMAVGNQEVCEYILECREGGVTFYAFTDSQMCSAAYNIAAACDEIYITMSAVCGSIGCMLAVIDCSENFKESGLKVELFATGKYKGAGIGGMKMTDDWRETFNATKDQFFSMFRDNVTANRPDVAPETMQGQIFVGQSALVANLCDGIVDDLDNVLEMAG